MATRMTAGQATTFDRYSVSNAAQAIAQLHELGGCKAKCEPYDDMFTYNRWQAQGYQVRKGEHGAHLGVIITTSQEDETGKVIRQSRPWTTVVFCRCQVERKGNGHAAHAAGAA